MKNDEQVNVLFINMINPMRGIENLYPPLGPAYLASYIHKHMGRRKVKFQMISAKFEKEILELKPDIVAISCVSQNYNRAKYIARFSKKVGVSYVLLGGCHISLIPLSLDPHIDIGIIGEGEQTFLELMNIFVSKKKFDVKDLLSINGLAYWNDGEVKLTPDRSLIKSIDDIPMPDRTLFKVDKNKAYMFSSRGCPYKCVFCASTRLWDKVRFHSANYVVEEIKEMVFKYGVKSIDFYDDLFVANKKRLTKMVPLIKKQGLNKIVEFNVTGRANLIDDEICHLLKQMNVKTVSLGLESGSPEILKYLKGGNVTVEDNFKAVETIKKHGLYCIGSFIIGSPTDTRETIMDTLNFIRKSKLDEFAVYTLTPFPGTPVWEYAEKKNLIPFKVGSFDWSRLDVEYSYSHFRNIHLVKNITRDELYQLYLLFKKEQTRRNILKAGRLFFTNPSRFFYHVAKIAKRVLAKIYETV